MDRRGRQATTGFRDQKRSQVEWVNLVRATVGRSLADLTTRPTVSLLVNSIASRQRVLERITR